ncbi:coiled-coil domain-containing protein 42-like [Hippoglossus stenolepis]|uniref:coiled-coil domain-containing protein 42-like n=1 Tax=Hippoglossus stenolepis TaxID=195615 RepID=UPI001FAF3782|nr:coiled-coil domain-containing protein 42-like [Hippoglossus stenolepis]
MSPLEEPVDKPSTDKIMLTTAHLCKFRGDRPRPESPRTWWQSAMFEPLMKARCKLDDAKDNLLKTRQKDLQRKETIRERRLMLKHLQKRIDELQKENHKTKELNSSYNLFLKEEEVQLTFDEAEREGEEALQKEELLEKLKEETAELMETKDNLDHQLQMYTVYGKIMEKIQKMTKFKDAELLADNFQSQLLMREQLYQRECEAEEQVDQQEIAVAALKSQSDLMHLQRRNRLIELQTKMKNLLAEVEVWETKWSDIQKASANKTLRLAQAKMVILDLYEKTGGKLKAGGVGVNDTDKQLDKIQMYILEQDEVMERIHGDQSIT